MKYGLALLSIVPMRKEPMEQSEMVNQVLFGECYEVLNETDRWIEIRTLFDNYSGWIDCKLHSEVSESVCRNLTGNQLNVLDALLMNVELQGGKPVTIVAGSTLPGYDRQKNIMIIENSICRINWTFGKVQSPADRQIVSIAGMFQNTPYLWGGRTVFGCDCSGFVQTVYKIMGHALERDASEQAKQGEIIKDLTETQDRGSCFFRQQRRQGDTCGTDNCSRRNHALLRICA